MSTLEMTRPVISYDHQTPEYALHHKQVARDLLENTPVAWSDTHGGFWVVARHADAKRIAENWREFSSENRRGDQTRRGILIPQAEQPLTLNECDPPVHTKRRMIEAPYFTPKHLRNWVVAAEDYTRRTIDSFIEKGEVEFYKDLCVRVPAMTTLHVGGVDPEEWELFADPAGAFEGDVVKAYAEITERLVRLLEKRRDDPREDVASALAKATKADDEPLDIRVGAAMLHTIVTGGFDTATSVLCNALYWLDGHPEEREFLRQNPDAMGNAVEEFLREFPPVHNLARNVVEDVELGGQLLKAGDKVLMSLYAANHDPEKFEDPWTVKLDRPNARDHRAYSAGNHRCLGAPLARVELRHVLNEVLRRLPDYRIDHSRAQPFETFRIVGGWSCLPATFTPGPRSAPG